MAKSGIVEWKTKAVKDAVVEQLTRNMEAACHVVMTDARARLKAIRDPEWGRRYRTEVLARRLKFVVSREGNAIVGLIGVVPGPKGDEYGYYVEVGSRTAPAHPYLRPALMQNLKTITQILNSGGGGGGSHGGGSGGVGGVRQLWAEVRNAYQRGRQLVSHVPAPLAEVWARGQEYASYLDMP